MPSVLSKLRNRIYGREWSFPYNCYEVGHGWTPSCTEAAIDVGGSAFKNALPLYISLYLFTQLGLQRRHDPEAFLETFKSIMTSCSFLSFNLFSGMILSCILRNNSDRYYYRIQCFLPAFIASYLSIWIERPSRRPALAFYLANMSSELLYKWTVQEGYLRPLSHGETLLFSAGMACWLRFVRIHGFGHDPVSTAMKYLIGPHEAKSRARRKKLAAIEPSPKVLNSSTSATEKGLSPIRGASNEVEVAPGEPQRVRKVHKSSCTKLNEGVNSLLNQYFDCYHICPHKGISCLNYTLTPAITRFGLGYLCKSLLNLSGKINLLISNPRLAFIEAFTARSSTNFGLFLGTFVGATTAVHCLLRRVTGKQEVWHSTVAGGLSGFSMLFSPKSTLSTYVVWKCLEQYFFLAVERGQISSANECIALVYAFSVNILLYIFAIEPAFIRPSYMKFIDKISDHRLHQVNRMVLDVFSPRASMGYEDWFPNLDPKHMSREFHELIFNWLIQPH